MKYIRTKDNRIIDLTDWQVIETYGINSETGETVEDICYQHFYFEYTSPDAMFPRTEYLSKNTNVLDEADNVDDLIRDDDILYIHDLYPDAVLVVEGNIKPFGYNDKIKLKDWLKYNDSFDLYTRSNKDNYILVAKRNDKGEWTVIK